MKCNFHNGEVPATFLNVDGQQVFYKTEWSPTHALAFGLYEAA